jgi:MATE family multidrug resistance protein
MAPQNVTTTRRRHSKSVIRQSALNMLLVSVVAVYSIQMDHPVANAFSTASVHSRGRATSTAGSVADRIHLASLSELRLASPLLRSSHYPSSSGTRRYALADKGELDVSNDEKRTINGAVGTAGASSSYVGTKRKRFLQALPQIFNKKDDGELDKLVLRTAIPSMINLGVVPIVNSVDTFWVGRLGLALALAGQSAANQACFTVFFMIAFLPNITAPLVAKAVASGNQEEAQDRICESLYLCNVLGILGTGLLVLFPRQVLSFLVLEPTAPAMKFAAPYLRYRALGMVPSLMAATGSAAYRGMLNTVTPLKVSLATNAINLVLDPLLIFTSKMGFVGAAIATAIAEGIGGFTYLRLLFRRKLVRWSKVLKPPPMKAILPLLQGGAAMLFRSMAINIGFLVATRRAQIMDPSGVAGAAYGITMQIYSVGIIMLVAMQNCAAALVPSSLAKEGTDAARQTADRLFTWSSLAGLGLGLTQFILLPLLVPVFSTLPEVQEAVRIPSLVASLIHVVNGPILAGEGVMIGMGCYKDLALITFAWIGGMVACLSSPLGKRLDGIMWSILLSSLLQQAGVITHFLKIGPLAIKKRRDTKATTSSSSSSDGERPTAAQAATEETGEDSEETTKE